jgi:hypothetical protein
MLEMKKNVEEMLILVFVCATVVLLVLTRSFRLLNEYLSETCTLCT